MLKSGVIVKIFGKPVTGENFEGKAELVTRYRADLGDGFSMWEVEFLDEPGGTYLRTVNASNADPEWPAVLTTELRQFKLLVHEIWRALGPGERLVLLVVWMLLNELIDEL